MTTMHNCTTMRVDPGTYVWVEPQPDGDVAVRIGDRHDPATPSASLVGSPFAVRTLLDTVRAQTEQIDPPSEPRPQPDGPHYRVVALDPRDQVLESSVAGGWHLRRPEQVKRFVWDVAVGLACADSPLWDDAQELQRWVTEGLMAAIPDPGDSFAYATQDGVRIVVTHVDA